MHTAVDLLAIAGDPNAEAAQHLRDLLMSWMAQAAPATLCAGVTALAFAHGARERDDGPARRYVRGAVVALGVFAVLQVVLGGVLLEVVIWPDGSVSSSCCGSSHSGAITSFAS